MHAEAQPAWQCTRRWGQSHVVNALKTAIRGCMLQQQNRADGPRVMHYSLKATQNAGVAWDTQIRLSERGWADTGL